MNNKPVEDVTACVVDYGSFTALAEKLAETMKLVYYHSPVEQEFKNVTTDMIGEGLPRVKKLEDIFDMAVFKKIDLFIFPDVGYAGLQRYLRSIGKFVWGSNGADELELYRDMFIDTLKEVGLPTAKSVVVIGVTALGKYLKNVTKKWIKINRFRDNMETWFHVDFDHSARKLESLAVIFGGIKEQITFVVQDVIESDLEIGYDGWCIDGKYPVKSFQGYEKKNELYLGSLLNEKDLPEEILYVNEKMSAVLKDYGYRNWWATEIRIAEGKPYFIDPTARHPGQTGEHQWETCTNLADVIWQGAQGYLIVPEFDCKFAAEATLHYESDIDANIILKEWKVLRIPKKVQRWFKPYHYCMLDGEYHFVPYKKDEVGIVIGVGNSIQESIEHLKENVDILKQLPIYANLGGLVDLLESIQKAKDYGIKFANKIPDPKTILQG